MSPEHGPALPEALDPAFAALLLEETQRLTPVVTEMYQSALATFGSETQAQKQLILALLKEFTCKACQDNAHRSLEQPIAFVVHLAVRLVKDVCGAEMIAIATPSPEADRSQEQAPPESRPI